MWATSDVHFIATEQRIWLAEWSAAPFTLETLTSGRKEGKKQEKKENKVIIKRKWETPVKEEEEESGEK